MRTSLGASLVFALALAPITMVFACTDSRDVDEPVATPGEDGGTKNDSATNEDDARAAEDATSSDAKSDAPAEDALIGTPKKIFVTSLPYSGNLGGTSGADGKCVARAVAANLSGTFKAWLSTTGTDDAKSRLLHSNGPYVRVDNVVVAKDWNALTEITHLAAVDLDEKGMKLPAGTAVWTNTLPNGTSKGGEHCLQWASASNGEIGAYGVVEAKDSRWTNAAIGACAPSAHLYCLEQ